MLEIILLVIIFFLGIYFGSFFTLATYRLPKHEDITHKHSYCPSCNHKLGILDLVPVFSYIFLRGKCRYCGKKIGIRYFIFEILTGIVFVIYTISLKINIYNFSLTQMIYLCISFLYFAGLFIIAGIEKEKGNMQKSVLIFSVFVSLVYMIYSYTLIKTNVYEYVIYLGFMIILFIMDIKILKRSFKYNYLIQILILLLNILIFTGTYRTIDTLILTILSIGIKNILQVINKNKSMVYKEKKKTPYAFYISVSNIIVIIMMNFVVNYII